MNSGAESALFGDTKGILRRDVRRASWRAWVRVVEPGDPAVFPRGRSGIALRPRPWTSSMDHERLSARGATGRPASIDISDEVFAALVRLTELRLARGTLADLPAPQLDRLLRALNPDQIAEILRIDDLDLADAADERDDPRVG